MKALITLGVVALIVLGVALVAWILTRSKEARRDRRDVQRHEDFLHHLHKTALAAADVEPSARVVVDEVLSHLNHTDRKAVR